MAEWITLFFLYNLHICTSTLQRSPAFHRFEALPPTENEGALSFQPEDSPMDDEERPSMPRWQEGKRTEASEASGVLSEITKSNRALTIEEVLDYSPLSSEEPRIRWIRPLNRARAALLEDQIQRATANVHFRQYNYRPVTTDNFWTGFSEGILRGSTSNWSSTELLPEEETLRAGNISGLLTSAYMTLSGAMTSIMW